MKLLILVLTVLHYTSSRPLDEDASDSKNSPQTLPTAASLPNSSSSQSTTSVQLSSNVQTSTAPTILKYASANDGLGTYSYNFETSNGITRSESGQIHTDATGQQVLRVEGSYSYVAPDNSLIEIVFVADENGYRPKIKIIKNDVLMKIGDINDFDVDDKIGAHVAGSLIGGGIGR